MRAWEVVQRILCLGPGPFCGLQIGSVSFVHRNEIGEFHHAALNPLQLVACPSQCDEQEEVDHVMNRSLRLPDANCLNENGFKSRRLAQQHRLACALSYAAQGAARWRGPDERHIAGCERVHACLVAEDASTGDPTAGIDREHRDFLSVFANKISAEHFDDAALTCARNTGNADADRTAAMGKAVFDDLFGQLAIRIARALDQCDSPSKNGSVATQNAIQVLLPRKRARARSRSYAQFARRLRCNATGTNMQLAVLRIHQLRSFLQPECPSGSR